MKLIGIAAVAAVAAIVAGDAVTAAGPSQAPSRRLDYRRLLPFWSPRCRRRELSPTAPAPTANAHKRQGSPSSPTAADLSIPPGPTLKDPFEIEDPFPEDVLTGIISATTTGTDSGSATSTGGSPTGTSQPDSLASDSIWEEAANHGCRLFDAMRDSEHDAGQLYNPPKDSVQSTLMSYENDFQGWGCK